jgi:hypothetical protein
MTGRFTPRFHPTQARRDAASDHQTQEGKLKCCRKGPADCRSQHQQAQLHFRSPSKVRLAWRRRCTLPRPRADRGNLLRHLPVTPSERGTRLPVHCKSSVQPRPQPRIYLCDTNALELLLSWRKRDFLRRRRRCFSRSPVVRGGWASCPCLEISPTHGQDARATSDVRPQPDFSLPSENAFLSLPLRLS